MREKLKAEVC